LDWLRYRVIHVAPDEGQTRKCWTLLREEVVLAVFASRFGAEAEGRRLSHQDCIAGQNARLAVHNLDGSIDAEFTFSAPKCE
jgi:hypothetical protein